MTPPKRKSDSGATSSSSFCSRSRTADAQFELDARLISSFEKSIDFSDKPFNYSTEVLSGDKAPPGQVPAYLRKIQRGGLIQPFGFLLCIDPSTFSILAFSDNIHDLLGPTQLGSDVRPLFVPTSAATLVKAILNSGDLSLHNPIWVCSNSTGKYFYAILHRLDVGVVIDFEPSMSPDADPGPSIIGAVQSQKLTANIISKLQALPPGGDVAALCYAIVEYVRELMGYDRVMVYKFHKDEHGEVVAEAKRSDLQSYLGLHYPATDIPQAARFLFKQNKVRMICDCNATPVRVIQDMDRLSTPLCLVNSTLRAPHQCHAEYMANMGSMASLVMAITINDKESLRLWGLLVCHHTKVRYVPFPVRHSCEFLVQAFSLQLSMEVQLAAGKVEKKILHTLTMLCDVLLRDNTLASVVKGHPTIMDLIRCDGAALYCKGKIYLLNVTPTESQLLSIIQWLMVSQCDSTGMSTDSLLLAGYPGAAALEDRVCGMACVRISDADFVFWFRSATSKEVRWGGMKHDPNVQDDDRRMHPRLSFKAFLEVMKMKSTPWEDEELNAIHSLQLTMRGVHEESLKGDVGKECPGVGGGGHGGGGGLGMQKLEEIKSVASEIVRLIESANVPVISIDLAGLINGWNAKAAELTGLSAGEAMGRSLVYELLCKDSRDAVAQHLFRALQGHEDRDIELKLKTFGLHEKDPPIDIVANACTNRDPAENIVGVSFVGQDVTGMKTILDRFVCLQGDYEAIVRKFSPLIPPLFICDENSCCSEWNAAMETLTGWTRREVLGKVLPGEVFGGYCRFKDEDALVKFKIALHKASVGQNTENEYFSFYDKNMKLVEMFLMVNGRTTREGKNIGSICFLQTTPDIQQVFEESRRKCLSKLKGSTNISQELKNLINVMQSAHQRLEESGLSGEQEKLLQTSATCEKQMLKVIEDTELEFVEKGTLKLESSQFTLESVLATVIAQAMPLVEEKGLQLLCQIPEKLRRVSLCGDQFRLQQVLANFLLKMVKYTTCPNGSVEIRVRQNHVGHDSSQFIFRISHVGPGLPSELIKAMFDRKECLTNDGFSLNISTELLTLMGGGVQCVREAEGSYILIGVELQLDRGNMS